MLATVSIIMPLSALLVLRVAVAVSKRRLGQLNHHEVEFDSAGFAFVVVG